jgi:hypothetical protein
MILVEKRALKERKNYPNMAIRLKKNFKRFYYKSFYFKRILKSKIKRYNSFLKLRGKSLIRLRRLDKKGRPRIKKLRLNKKQRILFVKRLYKLGYKKRHFFCYLRQRIESIRLKKFLVKYR